MIEDIIYNHLSKNQKLSMFLASYGDKPAVFNEKAPDDLDECWNSENQYPRLIFELNMQDDPARKISGHLLIDFYYDDDSGFTREDIEPIIRSAVDGYFFSDDTDTIAAQWQQTDSFVTSGKDSRIVGLTLTYSIIAFPPQTTTDPDPVKALNDYIKNLYEDCVVIGQDNLKSTWKPTDKTPAVYCQLTLLEPGSIKGGYHVTWFDPTIQIHIIAPANTTRSVIAKTISEDLQEKTRIILPDNSPFMIQTIKVNNGADYFKVGQLSVRGTYGVLRKYPDVENAKNISVKE